MKNYIVRLVEQAEQDMIDIYRYVEDNDSTQAADQLLNKLEKHCDKLSIMPERGRYPPELERVAVTNYRETIHKPFRIIYQVLGKQVFIHAVVDSRRDLETHLQCRFITP